MDKVTDFASKNKNIIYIVLAVIIIGLLVYWFYPRQTTMLPMPYQLPTAGYGMEEFRQGPQGPQGRGESTDPARIILFYAPWCPHCRKIMDGEESIWQRLKRKYGQRPELILDQIDGDEHPELTTKFGVSGYPMIVKLKKDTMEKYNGDRSMESIEKFIGSE